MRINNNIMAMNAHRQLAVNQSNAAKSMERLSSGLRINRAGDDAAGLAISEKMRGQIRGLKQAARNAQDGISMIQTAEGALNETHAILQRMRELATQASNDTNVEVDRDEIQKEINALTSEINRIGNTTEFNTQALLKGDGNLSIPKSGLFASDVSATGTDVVHTEASTAITVAAGEISAGDGFTIDLNGVTLTFATADTSGTAGDITVSGDTATLELGATTLNVTQDEYGDYVQRALQSVIDNNEVLAGNYEVSYSGGNVTISAVSGGAFEGAAGSITNYTETQDTNALLGGGADSFGTTIAATVATTTLDFTATGLSLDTAAEIEALAGKGFTINDQQVEFYNANDGAYTGEAIGINISDAITASTNNAQVLADIVASQLNDSLEGISASATSGVVTISTTDTGSDATLEITDGGIQSNFTSTFQVGSNAGQSMTIQIDDMRALALEISTKDNTAAKTVNVDGKDYTVAWTKNMDVTNGTDAQGAEYALDVSTHDNATAAIKVIDDAITTVSAERSKLGAYQNRLEHTISNLGTSAENLQAAESRIRDLDMAEEIMAFTKNNILQQAATAMLAQANMAPQSVLQLLG
jgi:flagellin